MRYQAHSPQGNQKLGKCFEKSAKYIVENRLDQFFLVHGVVTGQGKLKGKKYIHAWLEHKELPMVMDVSFPGKQPMTFYKSMYYKSGKIKVTTKYTWDQVITHLDFHGNYGPWNPKLDEHL